MEEDSKEEDVADICEFELGMCDVVVSVVSGLVAAEHEE